MFRNHHKLMRVEKRCWSQWLHPVFCSEAQMLQLLHKWPWKRRCGSSCRCQISIFWFLLELLVTILFQVIIRCIMVDDSFVVACRASHGWSRDFLALWWNGTNVVASLMRRRIIETVVIIIFDCSSSYLFLRLWFCFDCWSTCCWKYCCWCFDGVLAIPLQLRLWTC